MRVENNHGSHPLQQGTDSRQTNGTIGRPVAEKESGMEDTAANKATLEKAITGLNEFLEPLRTSARFQLHEKLNRYYVSVINTDTDEVIKEIPPKKMLDMYAEIAEFMGILMDEKG